LYAVPDMGIARRATAWLQHGDLPVVPRYESGHTGFLFIPARMIMRRIALVDGLEGEYSPASA
jgi:hypothetical protein